MGQLTDAQWWRAAIVRALRTAIIIAVPYVAAGMSGAASYVTIASAAGFGFVLSLLTSLVGIKEAQGVAVPWWYAVLDRVVRTTAQAIVTAVGNAVLFTDVHWSAVGSIVITSAFGSLLLGVLSSLPEAEDPIAAAATTITTSTDSGEVQQAVPLVQTTETPIANGAIK